MGFFAKLFGKGEVVGGPPPPARALPPPVEHPGLFAAPATPHAAVPSAPADLSALVSAIEHSAFPESGPRLHVRFPLPASADPAAARKLEIAIAELVVIDPTVIAAAQKGDIPGAERAALALATIEVEKYVATLPSPTFPGAQTVGPPPPKLLIAELDIGVNRLGRSLSVTAPAAAGHEVVVRLQGRTAADIAPLIRPLYALVTGDAEVKRLIAADDIPGAQQRAQQIVDASNPPPSPAASQQGGGVARNTYVDVKMILPRA